MDSARAHYRKRLDAGASTPEALRCLIDRRLARVVFNHLHTDHRSRNNPRGSESTPCAQHLIYCR